MIFLKNEFSFEDSKGLGEVAKSAHQMIRDNL